MAQDDVHARHHKGEQTLHDHRGKANRIDPFDQSPTWTDVFWASLDFFVTKIVEEHRDRQGDKLTEDGCPGRAFHAHIEGEDENVIEDDVDGGAGDLGDCAIHRLPRGLEESFVDRKADGAQGKTGADHQIVSAHLDDLLLLAE